MSEAMVPPQSTAGTPWKMGILLAFPPKTPLGNQGIGRLLTMLLGSAARQVDGSDTKPTPILLAAPRWSKNDIEKLLADNDVAPDAVELFFTKNTPFFMHLVGFMDYFRRRGGGRLKRLIARLGAPIRRGIARAMIRALSSNSFLAKTILLVLLLATGTVLAGGLVWLALQGWTWLALLAFTVLGTLYFAFRHRTKLMAKFMKKKTRGTKPGSKKQKTIRSNPFFFDLFMHIRQLEMERLIRSINRREDIKLWYIPTAFWPEVADITMPKVIAVPDVVFLDYPSFFTNHGASRTHDMITKTLNIPAHFLCYSEHVKDRHLVRGFGVSPGNVWVIPHGRSELHTHLQQKNAAAGTTMRLQALTILRQYQAEHLNADHYLRQFDFSQARFFLYSSQARPYKNLLHLLQAFHMLLRQKRVDAKLILTARLNELPEIQEYIQTHRLQMDVLAFHRIPSHVLAALNHLAIAAINPSLFEGGFPFTFSEAYSVGTPSLMADVLHVRETVTDPELAKLMLFNPYNVQEMAEKMAWAIHNRQTLLEAQHALYASQPSWQHTAEIYDLYFRSVS